MEKIRSQSEHEGQSKFERGFRAVMYFILLVCLLFVFVVSNKEGSEAWQALITGQKAAGYDIYDDFDDNLTHGWYVGFPYMGDWSGALSVKDGAYVWEMKEIDQPVGAGLWIGLDDLKPMRDFDMSVDARLTTPNAGHMCYGMAFRIQMYTAEGYSAQVCEDQTFSIHHYSDRGQFTTFHQNTFSDAIHPGEWNTLFIRARGDHFILSINDQVVSEFTDAQTAEGRFKLLLQAYDDTPGTVMFDNFGLQSRDE